MPASPSLRTLAELTGYSLGTVSMALRGDHRVGAKTRKVIKDAAAARGYLPDPLFARRMNQVRRRTVKARAPVKLAHIVAWDRLESYYGFKPFRNFRDGAAERARELGYELEDFLVDGVHMQPRRLVGILRARSVPGVLIAPVQRQPALVERLGAGLEAIDLDFAACATIGHTLGAPWISRAVHDHAAAVEVVCQQLFSRGYRRIGLALGGVMHRRVRGRWLAGWTCAQPDLLESPRPFIEDDLRAAEPFDRWFERQRPDAILTCEWETVWAHCRRLGLRIPDDLGLVDLQGPSEGAARAAVDQCDQVVGAAAIDIILGQLGRHERGRPAIPKTVLIQGRWVEGPTVRTPPAML